MTLKLCSICLTIFWLFLFLPTGELYCPNCKWSVQESWSLWSSSVRLLPSLYMSLTNWVWGPFILAPRGCTPFDQHQQLQPQGKPDFLSVHREFVSYSELITFVSGDSVRGQSDRKSVNGELPVLNLPRVYNSWCWPKGVWPLGTKMEVCRVVSYRPSFSPLIYGPSEKKQKEDPWLTVWTKKMILVRHLSYLSLKAWWAWLHPCAQVIKNY